MTIRNPLFLKGVDPIRRKINLMMKINLTWKRYEHISLFG